MVIIGKNDDGTPMTCGGTLREDMIVEEPIYHIVFLCVDEGYKTKISNNIRFAVINDGTKNPKHFDGKNHSRNVEPLLVVDGNSNGKYDSKFGTDTKWGWYNASERTTEDIYKQLVENIKGLNENNYSKIYGVGTGSINYRLYKIFPFDKEIIGYVGGKYSEEAYPFESEENNQNKNTYEYKYKYLTHASLGVIYRPTTDIGIYNDVTEAYLEINGKKVKYVYDKRAANGNRFRFGVNIFDIETKTITSEYTYGDAYYKYLSMGNAGDIKDSSEANIDKNITHKIDPNKIFAYLTPLNEEGKAGGYNEYPSMLRLTYHIQIVKQSETAIKGTELIDYYDKRFDEIHVYTNANRTQEINISDTSIKYSDRDETDNINDGISEYNKKYINIEGINEIYVDLVMHNVKDNLMPIYFEQEFKTINYAELIGYKTEKGLIDIDSVPGNLTNDGNSRTAKGPYEDDEGKSPTYIFQKDDNAQITIEGTVFEDATGKTDIKVYSNENRTGDGKLGSDDTPIAGAHVSLIEVDDSGNTIASGKENGLGEGTRSYITTGTDGKFKITNIAPGNYYLKYRYGDTEKIVLIDNGKIKNGGLNAKSYNGQDFQSTEYTDIGEGKYWYTEIDENGSYSYAKDDTNRRNEVISKSQNLTNKELEIFNAWKDSSPNENLVKQLIDDYKMFADTKQFTLEIEDYKKYKPDANGVQTVIIPVQDDGETKTLTCNINNMNFGIVERPRAELQITKKVSYISIVDSSGREITGGTEEEMKAGNIKYIKMVPNNDKTKQQGFVDMEIDSELLSGATLKITYEIKVENTSELGNDISNIQVVDYVSNNLNFDQAKNSEWTPVTVEQVKPYINTTSLDSTDISNKIDLSTYQTILMTTFNVAEPKTLTLEKNLSSEEDSNFNYENQVEIVSSYNPTGRGDYSSIYGNLDPTTYTSRQGNLNWYNIGSENQNGFRQMPTDDTVYSSGAAVSNRNAIRLAEKDSGNAEEVVITPPTGAKGIVFETQHYILAIIGLLSLAGAIILIKKYNKIGKE